MGVGLDLNIFRVWGRLLGGKVWEEKFDKTIWLSEYACKRKLSIINIGE